MTLVQTSGCIQFHSEGALRFALLAGAAVLPVLRPDCWDAGGCIQAAADDFLHALFAAFAWAMAALVSFCREAKNCCTMASPSLLGYPADSVNSALLPCDLTRPSAPCHFLESRRWGQEPQGQTAASLSTQAPVAMNLYSLSKRFPLGSSSKAHL